jgi:hypothetical protein
MSDIKTKPNAVTVENFLESLDDERQFEASTLIDIMEEVTGEKPVMWGSSIVGFGTMAYTYANGKEADWLRVGFSPRKGTLSLYLTTEAEQYIAQLDQIGGKYQIGKGCIYIRRLNDVDIDKLRELIRDAYQASFGG